MRKEVRQAGWHEETDGVKWRRKREEGGGDVAAGG